MAAALTPSVRKRPAAHVVPMPDASKATRKRPAAHDTGEPVSKRPAGAPLRICTHVTQAQLRGLACRPAPLQKLELDGSELRAPSLNFTERGLVFSHLQGLTIRCWRLHSAHLNGTIFPMLQDLHMTQVDWKDFHLELPELKDLVLEFPGQLCCKDLKASTVGCPKIDYLCIYKAYNLDAAKLTSCLPKATKVWLHRCEDLKALAVYGPFLTDLRLQACYDLKSVGLLEQFRGMTPPTLMTTSVVNVDLTNSLLPKKVIDALKDEPRMRLSGLPTKEEAMFGDDVSSSDEEEGDELRIIHFSDTDNCFYARETASIDVGVRLRHRCRGGRVVSIDDMKRAVKWGADVIYIWWIKTHAEALEHARGAGVAVVEFKKDDPRPSGIMSSPLMRFYRDVEQRARACRNAAVGRVVNVDVCMLSDSRKVQIRCTNMAGEELVERSLPGDAAIIDLVIFARKELGMAAATILSDDGLKIAKPERLQRYTKLIIKEMRICNVK